MTSVPVNLAVSIRGRAVLYALVLLATSMAAYADGDPSPLVLAVAAVLLAWTFVDSARAWIVPRIVVNLGILVAAGWLWFQVVRLDRDANLVLLLNRFMIALVLCKLLEQKAARDYTQILILTLLNVVATTMSWSTPPTLTYAFLLLAYFAAAVYAVILFHLRVAVDQARFVDHLPLALPPAGAARTFPRDLRGAALWVGLFLPPICLFVFLLLPRTPNTGILAAWSPAATFQTGFSDTVQFQRFGQLTPSDALVMEVTISQNGQNIGSEFTPYYFRGVALDAYGLRSHQWHQDYPGPGGNESPPIPLKGGDSSIQGFTTLPIAVKDVSPTSIITQAYSLHIVPPSKTLFAIAPPMTITAFPSDFTSVAFSEKYLTLTAPVASGNSLHYTVQSPAYFTPEVVDPPLITPGLGVTRAFAPAFGAAAPSTQPSVVAVPPEISRIAHNLLLAANIPPPAPRESISLDSIRPAVNCFVAYLKTYPYSLSFEQKNPDLDPVADFLINRKETGGHCEYFASAFVMLCRSVGINARLVNGYRGGDYNSLGGVYEVRQKHAHTWAEVCFPNTGWGTVDPSPLTGSSDIHSSAVGRWFRELLELTQNLWLATVVSYDRESRRAVLLGLHNFYDGLLDSLASAWKTLYIGAVTPESMSQRIGFVGPLLGLLALAVWLVRQGQRDRAAGALLITAWRRTPRRPNAIAFFDELTRLLARGNPPRRPGQTPREYLAQTCHNLGAASGDAAWLIQTFYALRYGGLSPTPELNASIAQAMRRVRVSHRAP